MKLFTTSLYVANFILYKLLKWCTLRNQPETTNKRESFSVYFKLQTTFFFVSIIFYGFTSFPFCLYTLKTLFCNMKINNRSNLFTAVKLMLREINYLKGQVFVYDS